jgi:uncharacterized membrane-anchored protein YhcB (DUF1043 family)
MNVLIFLLGMIVGLIAGATISIRLLQRRIRWERSPRGEVENFIAEFNRFYKESQRESNSQ